MTYLEALLTETRKLIDAPEKWCKGTYTLHDDCVVGPVGAHADSGKCRFCLAGALYHAADKVFNQAPDWDSVFAAFRKPIARKLSMAPTVSVSMSLTAFNDLPSTTHEDVLAVLDETLASISKSPPVQGAV